MKPVGRFYYDIISPFGYLFLKMRAPLEKKLTLKPVPIFLPGLLRAQSNIGPAEVDVKRAYTYATVVWKAKSLGVPLTFPRRHPFASASAQRLLLSLNADMATVDRAFAFVWADGNDPETQWEDFCAALDLPRTTPKPEDKAIKQALIQNTADAATAGVFGVPTVEVNGHVFWGCDHFDWLVEYLDHPDMFQDSAYSRALATENPLAKAKKL
ncbi:hypothetical protein H257_11741 [Aphanomyces astaci]|nr:hypothetical protein H257_11741 [Aphanomyces astaci]ETV73634.1 hypothetical protein H257_11741 [Aphanomyces astaci]RHY01966.1 hypothetical protein DYB25_010345 [Aphanomyces astaci]RHY09085.1 hypothetical protein DYB36_002729 [Aphanomyces astaci]RHY48073.1 hypothetical protein DYB30_008238 [Aphanomyces astaci]RHY77394.1 hypothetical protein DYB38_003624 [Aphanomyces astaci]|eukprot:XP_009837060.1 hypothetical protein H257_11741 [Aphanomyces astaci]